MTEHRESAAPGEPPRLDPTRSEHGQSLAQLPLRAALEQSGTPMVVVAPDGRIVLLNEAMRRTLALVEGREAREGSAFLEHVRQALPASSAECLVPRARHPIASALRGRATRGQELYLTRADGSHSWQRVDASPLRDAAGVILGALSTCMDIDARREPKGARLAHEAGPAQAPRGPDAPRAPASSILVVDDDPAVRAVATALLARMNHRVVTAASGEEALQLLRRLELEFDLVVLDLSMPGMDGEVCFAELRKLHPELDVVITSGRCEAEVVSRFEGQQRVRILQKPYRSAELCGLVQGLLESR